jgi:glycosyltransferase involved in cell wall biosynthesis
MECRMRQPGVTVLIDTYNHERFIEEAIVSVLGQDFPASEMEILVVDDGSTDRTPEIVRKFEPRVRLLQKTNGGQASAFNAGIPEARGEIVSFLDGDDWWARNKLSRVMETITADPELGIVGNGIVMVQLDGSMQSEVLREHFQFQANTVEGARLFRLRKSFLGTSRLTVRRDLLRRIGAVPEILRVEADEYLFTLAAVLMRAEILPDAVTYYRFHDSNGFQMSTPDLARLRKKQAVLDSLAKLLAAEMNRYAIEPHCAQMISEIVQVEADQIRLSLGEGSSAETFRTEWKIYEVLCPTATLAHRIFKMLSLIPSLLMPPKRFYELRGRLVSNSLYRAARAQILPNPTRPHVENVWTAK